MDGQENKAAEFTSYMSRGERIFSICYLPVHLLVMPSLALVLLQLLGLDENGLNFAVYALGAALIVLFDRKFLRRDFDRLCDRPGYVLVQVLVCYGALLCLNLAVNSVLMIFLGEGAAENPNNQEVISAAGQSMGAMKAAAVFLAPLLEEVIFRGGVFGGLRKHSRVLAYAGSMLLFSLYHVWSYVIDDPRCLVYVVQYLPASFLLCRCYEHTDSIWGSVFLHMLSNGISFAVMEAVGML